MGARINPHEIYIGSLLEPFNLRFGPAYPAVATPWLSGGIVEIAALQREFSIFRAGRPFLESAALLGLTGALYSPAKERWVGYLAKLPEMKSDNPAESGDQRIVNALLANFDRDGGPLPCFMQAHDGRRVEPGLVTVAPGVPLFYLESVQFLTIQLPMRPERPDAAAAARGPRRPGGRRRRPQS
jgi:hypothetical protein